MTKESKFYEACLLNIVYRFFWSENNGLMRMSRFFEIFDRKSIKKGTFLGKTELLRVSILIFYRKTLLWSKSSIFPPLIYSRLPTWSYLMREKNLNELEAFLTATSSATPQFEFQINRIAPSQAKKTPRTCIFIRTN